MKQCDGDGCQNTVPSSQELCGACKVKAQQEEARISLWATQGIKAFREYLAKQAEFTERYGPN